MHVFPVSPRFGRLIVGTAVERHYGAVVSKLQSDSDFCALIALLEQIQIDVSLGALNGSPKRGRGMITIKLLDQNVISWSGNPKKWSGHREKQGAYIWGINDPETEVRKIAQQVRLFAKELFKRQGLRQRIVPHKAQFLQVLG